MQTFKGFGPTPYAPVGMWQDPGMTIPCTNAGDPVVRFQDIFTGVGQVGTARTNIPTLEFYNGKPVIRCGSSSLDGLNVNGMLNTNVVGSHWAGGVAMSKTGVSSMHLIRRDSGNAAIKINTTTYSCSPYQIGSSITLTGKSNHTGLDPVWVQLDKTDVTGFATTGTLSMKSRYSELLGAAGSTTENRYPAGNLGSSGNTDITAWVMGNFDSMPYRQEIIDYLERLC